MRYVARRLLLPSVFLTGLLMAVPLSAQTITVLHVNDTHSHLDAFGPKDRNLDGTIGGLEKAATVLASVRASEPNVLLLHAGDAYHGDFFSNLYFDVPEYQLLKQLGVDAMAIGNHEFDLGPTVLAMALGNVGPFPLLSANLDFSQCQAATCGDLPGRVAPSLIKEVGGVKVGIFGMTVPTDPTMRPAPVIVRGDVVPIASGAVASLRASGAQVVILLSHLGILYDRAVAGAVPGIDFIVGGHDHNLFPEPLALVAPNGGRTYLVSVGEFYEHVGKLRFTLGADGTVSLDHYQVVDVDETIPAAPAVAQVVEQLKAGVVARYGDVYHTPIAYAAWDLSKASDPAKPWRDTAMGNLVTDALRRKGDTQIAIAADGLISEGMYRGPIVGADVFRPMSYGFDPATRLGFKIATFDITGAELIKGMEATLSFLGLNDAFFLQFSGLRYKYDPARPVGQRILLESVRVQGRRLDLAATYSVTVNEGIAVLLPGLGVQVTNLRLLPEFEYHVVKDYVEGLGFIAYTPQGRIWDVSVWGR
jgi:5'-nucleotidase / UDP-sugar diphosphatase